jgi:EmrB/QacA subfamily drug resistance transporter
MPATGNDRRWLVLAVVSVTQFMIVADASIVNVMDARLQQALHLSTPALQWVMNIYILLFGGLLLLGGRLADVVGRRPIFLTGVVTFSLASLLIGMSHTASQVLWLRAVQGIAAALMSPAALSILVTTFMDLTERNKAFGVWGAVIGAGAAVGVLLGGAIANVDWRWAFWINVPVGLMIAVAAIVVVPAGRPAGQRPPTDFAGALTVTGGVLCLISGIVATNALGWTSPRTIGAFAGAAILLSSFVLIENRAKVPLIPLSLFRQRALVVGSLGEFLTAGIIMPAFFLLPIYLEDLHGYDPLRIGLAFLPVSITLVIIAPVLAQLINKTGPQLLYVLGTIMFAGMFVLLTRLPLTASYVRDLLPAISALALGMVLCLVTTPVIGTAEATEEDAGTVSAVLNTAAQLGAAFGIALAVTVFNGRTAHLLAIGVARPVAMDRGMQAGFLAVAILLVLSFVNGIVGYGGALGRARQRPAVSQLSTGDLSASDLSAGGTERRPTP